MENRVVFLSVVVLGLVAIVSAGTSSVASASGKSYSTSSSASSKSHHHAPAESERGGWGWSYPTGYSWSSGLSSVGLPLVLIPLIYFGFLWCILLFGVAAFHHVPHQGHSSGVHGQGWGHHRYRRHDVDTDYAMHERVLSSI